MAFAGRSISPASGSWAWIWVVQTPEQAQASLSEVLDSFDSRADQLRFQDQNGNVAEGNSDLSVTFGRWLNRLTSLDVKVISLAARPAGLTLANWTKSRFGRRLYDSAVGLAFVGGAGWSSESTSRGRPSGIRPDGSIDQQGSQVGRELDVEATWRRLDEALSHPGPQTVELAVNEVAPRVGTKRLRMRATKPSRF